MCAGFQPLLFMVSQKATNDPLLQRYSTIILMSELSPPISSLDCSSLSSRNAPTLNLSSCQQHLTRSSSRHILVLTPTTQHHCSKYRTHSPGWGLLHTRTWTRLCRSGYTNRLNDLSHGRVGEDPGNILLFLTSEEQIEMHAKKSSCKPMSYWIKIQIT